MPARTYIAIDLKSFYASVECADRKLDPLSSNLVVADLSRTEKTICLAVSPALKGFGVPGRPRLFEVVEKVRAINAERLQKIPGQTRHDVHSAWPTCSTVWWIGICSSGASTSRQPASSRGMGEPGQIFRFQLRPGRGEPGPACEESGFSGEISCRPECGFSGRS